jgi:hypothetical protein
VEQGFTAGDGGTVGKDRAKAIGTAGHQEVGQRLGRLGPRLRGQAVEEIRHGGPGMRPLRIGEEFL